MHKLFKLFVCHEEFLCFEGASFSSRRVFLISGMIQRITRVGNMHFFEGKCVGIVRWREELPCATWPSRFLPIMRQTSSNNLTTSHLTCCVE